MKIDDKSKTIDGNPWKAMKSKEIPWNSVKSKEKQRTTVKINKKQWTHMRTNENQWNSMTINEINRNHRKSMKIDDTCAGTPNNIAYRARRWPPELAPLDCLNPCLGSTRRFHFGFWDCWVVPQKTNTKRSGISHTLWTLIFYSILHAITIHWDCHVNSYILPPHVQILCFILACFRYGSEFLCYTCVSSLYDPNMKKLTKAEQKLSKAKQS